MVFRVAAVHTNCSKSLSCSFCSVHSRSLQSLVVYFRTTLSISHLLQPLEDIITTQLTVNAPFDDYARALLALPLKWGGIGLTNQTNLPTLEYLASCKLSQPLTDIISNVLTSHFRINIFYRKLM